MKLIKKHKQDILIVLLFSLIYILIAAILTHEKYYFAAQIDFPMQHYVFPEYFRNLFYETKDLFPDFALNIGGGQNIYNFSYYGLLSPYILISYLLPMIPMFYYLIGMSFIIVIISTFLFYKFLQSKNIDQKTSLVVALLFLLATPIIFHAKRHIMFINYFPFLILGLFGVDKFIKTKKINLLTISITLMIFTSFYYSVSGIIVLIIYGIYSYYKENKKHLFKFLLSFSKPFIIAVLISAILWLPTAYTLLMGRGETIKELDLWGLLIPNFKALYTSFSPGITILEFVLIALLMIDKKIDKRTRLLALVIIIIITFPIFNYILNGTLYENPKSLIPFLPLLLYLVAISISSLDNHKKKIEAFLLITTLVLTISSNFTDPLIEKNKEKEQEIKDYRYLVNKIVEQDKSLYRIGNETQTSGALNRVFNIKELKTSIYSSTQNKNYVDFLTKKQKTNLMYRNNMMITLSGNILTQSMMAEKYIITEKKLEPGYKLIEEKGKLKLYENEYSLPIMYASSDYMPKEEYKSLSYPENIVALYTKDNLDNNQVEKVNFKLKEQENLKYKVKKDTISITAKENAKLILEPNKSLEDKILFISFKNKFNRGCHHSKIDQTITINGVVNKLTCRDWKYHNNNYTFHYIIVSPKELKITFTEAFYKLGNFEIYAIPKSILENKQEEITPVKIKEVKQDKIVGTIKAKAKSYVELAIPYDTGFKIQVNNKNTQYQKSMQNGIAFQVSKGTNIIEVSYEAPWKNIATIISIIGILLWLLEIILHKKKNT